MPEDGTEIVADAPISDATEAPTAPAESGQGAEPEVTPEPSYLPTDDYASHLVRVKVDGEEVEVPLAEAISGYSRQADYTRKAQAVAQQRQEAEYALTVLQALDQDFDGTIDLLRRQYEQQAPQVQEEWPEDPYERARMEILGEVQQQLAPITQDYARRQLQETLGTLQNRYGSDFEPQAVVNEALRRGHRDPSQLEQVYKEMAFDRIFARQRAEADLTAQQAAEVAQREAAKSQIVSHSPQAASTAAAPTSTPQSVRESFLLAKQQLGMS
jgi:hypothetical protein